jgi:hypothetical protein
MPSFPSVSWELAPEQVVTLEAAGIEIPDEPIDLMLGDDSDLLIGTDLSFTTGLEAVVQGCHLRLLLFREEWFLDLDRGIPYHQEILGHNFEDSEVRIRNAFREELLSVPNVLEIPVLRLEYDSPVRTLSIRWKVRTTFGESSLQTTEVG